MARLIRAISLASLATLCAFSAHAASALPNWKNFAELDTVEIVTHDDDEDQTVRATTVWLVVQGGQGYIRTGGTTWGANVKRDPDLVLRMQGTPYELRATPIPAGELYDAVTHAFREKYGFPDALMGIFRGIGGAPTIMRLDVRPGIPLGN